MPEATITCPRCFHVLSISTDVKFCPHCGLADAIDAAQDTGPIDIAAGGKLYRVLDRVGVGSICSLYRCRYTVGGREMHGIFKVARDARANGWLDNEAAALKRLRVADTDERFKPFFPEFVDSVSVAGAGGARQANVLRYHDDIRSPEELYSLEEIRAAYADGAVSSSTRKIDERDIAWIWRRLLSVLGFAHTHGLIHAAVLPMHILIDPREHKLLLIDWCSSVYSPRNDPRNGHRPLSTINGGHRAWYRREMQLTNPPSPALDLSFAARCMIDLLGGDPVGETFPPGAEPAIQRHLQRCIGSAADNKPDAWKLLEDFDRLIEALWGPRQFKVLEMPPRSRA
jgi:serine/threonine protein kinase